MAILNVSPTRMELSRLKKRVLVAKRGHKLLKDKRDEMIRKFIELVRQNKELRQKMEQQLSDALKGFVLTRAVMSLEAVEEAVMYPARSVEVSVDSNNIMGVVVPSIQISSDTQAAQYPYGFASTSGELDSAIEGLAEVLPIMVELSVIEKTCSMLSDEIEKTRRRVNALEYVMIPQLEETVRYITMKLEENERANIVRLMKIKDMPQRQ